MFPRVVQYGDGRDAMATATAAPSEAASPAESDRVTRTHTGTSDASADHEPARRRPAASPDADDRLPAPLQYRDPARYEIVAEHGRGGLGRVFRARDKELGRDVALKELLSRGSTTELRFFREALITARLEHPGIVPVHEAGRWPDGTPFYAMKLVAGRPLKALIDECKTLEDRLALLPHVIAVADAIAYAHDRKIIHRDLKPSNIIVGDFGETVVIDWGLAKDISDQAPTDEPVEDGPYRTAAPTTDGVTVAGSIVGTPAYMSPEQARGEHVDERTDVYAIGAILHELCYGTTPRPWHAERSDRHVPPDLAIITRKALDGQALRYRSAAELSSDLRAYDAGQRITARHYSIWNLLGLWSRRHRGVTVTLGLAIVTGTILGLVGVSEIVSQRNRATSALDAATRARSAAESSAKESRRERDRARIALAKSLLASDPSESAEVVDQFHPMTLVAAHVRSVAYANGIARTRWRLGPSSIRRAAFDRASRTVTAAMSDSTLMELNVTNGRSRPIALDLVEPPFMAAVDGVWLYATRANAQIEVREASTSRTIASLSGETVPPDTLIAVHDELFILTRNGQLLRSRIDSSTLTPVASSIRGIARTRTGVLACTEDGKLQRFDVDGGTTALGRCAHPGSASLLATAGSFYVAPVGDDALVIDRDGQRETLHMQLGENSDVSLSSSGLLAAIDAEGRPHMQAGARTLWRGNGRATGRATVARAVEEFAVWGYSDGSVRVVDASSEATWDFGGHDGVVTMVEIIPEERLVVSAGGTEVRVWQLDTKGSHTVAALGCQSLNVVSSPDSTGLLSDCQDGSVLLADGGRTPVRLHQHDSLAFSVAWLGNEACSAGWDGRVMCTDIATKKTRMMASHSARVRWITTSLTTLYYAVADGSVWAASADGAPPARLFTHTAEVARLALDTAGNRLAAGGQDGSVIVYDLSSGHLTKSREGHDGRVTQLRWIDEELFTSGSDGTVRRWSNELRSTILFHRSEPIRHFVRTDLGWFGALGNNQIVRLDAAATDPPLQMSPTITYLTGSPDERYAAFSSGHAVTIIDTRDRGISSWPLEEVPEIPCIAFGSNASLHFCSAANGITTVDVSTLEYVPFVVEATTPTQEIKP